MDKREHFFKMFFVAVLDIEMNSVPGICSLARLGTTNKEVFGVDANGHYSIDKLRLIRDEVWHRFDAVTQGKTYSDPLKVFIKQEPHKRKKLEDGRLRLIMSVSLIDAFVDRILFMKLAQKIVTNFHKTNIMIGWSPMAGGYRLISSLFSGMKTLSIDKKAWDWTVPYWLLNSIKRVILHLAVDKPDWWVLAVEARFKCLFEDPVFSFGDGSIGRQTQPGVMKSGCYLTIIVNSLGQLLLHEMAKNTLQLGDVCEPIVVLGDDSLQKHFDRYHEYVGFLQKLGFMLETSEHDGRCSFAGFTYDNDFKPEYKTKHLFLLSHLTTDRIVAAQTLQQYQGLYYFDAATRELIKEMIRILDMPEAYVNELSLRAIALG